MFSKLGFLFPLILLCYCNGYVTKIKFKKNWEGNEDNLMVINIDLGQIHSKLLHFNNWEVLRRLYTNMCAQGIPNFLIKK